MPLLRHTHSFVAFLFCVLFVFLISFCAIALKVLEMAEFPSQAVKIQILAAMLVSLIGPHLVDRVCVRLFHPELHRVRKAGPPLGKEV